MNNYSGDHDIGRDPTVPHHPRNIDNGDRSGARPGSGGYPSYGSVPPRRVPSSPRPSSGASRRTAPSSGARPAPSGRRTSRRRGMKASPLFSMLFFPCALLYHELLLRLYDRDSSFFAPALFRILLFSLAYGLMVFLILDLIPAKKVSRWVGGLLSFAFIVVMCVERGMKGMFGIYYGVLAAAATAGNAVGEFGGNVVTAIIDLIPFILLSLIPLVFYVIRRRAVFYEKGQRWSVRGFVLILLVLAQFFAVTLSTTKAVEPYYTYDFNIIYGIPEFGLANSVRLEFQYALFGMPEADMSSFLEDPSGTQDPGGEQNPGGTQDPGGEQNPDGTQDPGGEQNPGGTQDPGGEQDPPAPPREYGPNVIDSIDFAALAESTSDKTLKSMHEYFGSLTPSMENEYTGLFAGKNLILICAESFDDYVVDPELTPTLYRMTQQEGFVFTNFYQPDWTLSTCGGEFSVTTGVIPNWVNKSDSARQSINNAMPTTLGNMFRAIGYFTPAWHNGDYTFYNRNEYLATYGYDFKAIGSGLELPTKGWLASDSEMIEATADEYINNYLQTGQPFHTYYMTISGHGPWKFSGNKWATKYRSLVEAKYPGLSEPAMAFLAANIELDRAMEVLVKKLEDAGIADDTLVVLAADHYPYFLYQGNSQQGDDTDYYNELNVLFGRPEDDERVTSRYRSTLMMWSASIPRTVVNTPCYSCDIVPTVCNLFGLDYDSRLYTGRDIFATNYKADEYSSCMPLVIFANNHGQGNSWITAAGTYEASTGVFTPNEGITVADDYVKKVKNLVNGKIRNSKLIITKDYYDHVFN